LSCERQHPVVPADVPDTQPVDLARDEWGVRARHDVQAGWGSRSRMLTGEKRRIQSGGLEPR